MPVAMLSSPKLVAGVQADGVRPCRAPGELGSLAWSPVPWWHVLCGPMGEGTEPARPDHMLQPCPLPLQRSHALCLSFPIYSIKGSICWHCRGSAVHTLALAFSACFGEGGLVNPADRSGCCCPGALRSRVPVQHRGTARALSRPPADIECCSQCLGGLPRGASSQRPQEVTGCIHHNKSISATGHSQDIFIIF